MNLGRAFTFAFEDSDWIGKLVVIAALTFAGLVLLPFLLAGLIPLTILLGYMLEISANVRDQKPNPLPRWDNLGDRLSFGAGLMVALLVYNIPLMLLSCCAFITPGGGNLLGGLASIVLLCCALPISILYTLVMWPVVAVGAARYLHTRRISTFFEVGRHYDTVSALGSNSLQWILCNLILLALFMIPCIGWLIAGLMSVPVYGHLLGQYARLVDQHDAKRRKRAPARA